MKERAICDRMKISDVFLKLKKHFICKYIKIRDADTVNSHATSLNQSYFE